MSEAPKTDPDEPQPFAPRSAEEAARAYRLAAQLLRELERDLKDSPPDDDVPKP